MSSEVKSKILIYGDSNLNIIDGSSVWIVNLSKLIAQDGQTQVDILLKLPIKNDVLSRELEKYSNLNLISPKKYLKGAKMINDDNVSDIIGEIDKNNNYSAVIVRGKSVVSRLVKTKLKSKMIPYLTDFCQDKTEITQKEKDELSLIYNSVENMFIQTEEMVEYFKDVLNIDGAKFTILSPIVFPLPSVEKEPKTLCYAGKLAKGWYIEELIEIMAKLYEKDSEIKLYFIGNKFNYDLLDFKDEVTAKLEAAPNIEYIPQLPNEETRKVINKCELGYGFRSRDIDNDDSLELSTKFLEYGFFDMPTVLRKTRMYVKILGDDYPLYVESVDEATEKIYSYFANPDEKITNISEKFEAFNNQTIYDNIKTVLDSYASEKSGFGFKRLKRIFR